MAPISIPNLLDQWNARYRSGDMPWDSGVTPPEVTSFWSSGRLSPAGRALDLGCGTGTNVAYLASLGLRAVGVEFSGIALRVAVDRLGLPKPGLLRQIELVQADVVRLPFSGIGASYILDIGCLHGIPPALRQTYADGIDADLKPGGYYHLFASDRHSVPPRDNPESAWRGMADNEVENLFTPALELVEVLRGNPDHFPCRWYLLHKRQ